MPRKRFAVVDFAQYLALRTAAGVVQCFDVEQNLQTAASIGSIFYRANSRRRQRAERNIALSFPDWSDERVRQVAEASMQYMFQLFLVDMLVTPRLITPASWPRYVRLMVMPSMIERMVRGRPTIFVTGHLGNWELLGFALSVIGYPMAALARPLDNPLINRWLLEIREARGMKIITKWGATPILQSTLERGGCVGFIADQNAGDQGLFVPFFGRLASSYKSIGLLAMHYDVPIVAGSAHRVGQDLRYEIRSSDVIAPEDWRQQEDPLFYITARFNRAIEHMVRAAPEQYLWLHRRWKSRPRHEREGRPIPRRLIQKLESLPWMTASELDRIVSLSSDPNHLEVR